VHFGFFRTGELCCSPAIKEDFRDDDDDDDDDDD